MRKLVHISCLLLLAIGIASSACATGNVVPADSAGTVGTTTAYWLNVFTHTLTLSNAVAFNADDTTDIGSSSEQAKDAYIDGIAYLDAINAEVNVYSNSQTLTSADLMVLYNSGGDATEDVTTNTLPEASANLGMAVWISVASDAGDLEVITDGTDSFVDAVLGAATPGSNKVTFANALDGALFVAAGSNYWALLNQTGATIGAQ